MDRFAVVDLKGGFGNQLFQYAFGRVLQEKLGITVYYNDEYYHKQQKIDNRWNSEGIYYSDNTLFVFGLPVRYAEKFHLDYIREYNKGRYVSLGRKLAQKLFKLPKIVDGQMLESCSQRFYEHFLDDYPFIHYVGYYQNEKYFKPIEHIIRNEFVFSPFSEDDVYNTGMQEKICSCSNPVFVHVRRGDYVKLGWSITDTDYYKNACQYIKSKINDAKFFVFSDDMAYIKKYFDIGYDFEIIENINFEKCQDYKDMQLMTHFKHAVIANSSFSWWGAWLIKNKNKIVTAPKPWFLHEGRALSINQIICDDWVGIEY